MSVIGDILKSETSKMMDFHKRQATGKAVESLREEFSSNGVKIFGIDYWKEINEGVKAGTLVSLDSLINWGKGKSSRYGISLPPFSAIQRRLYAKGSSTPQEKLEIAKQVLISTKTKLDIEVKKQIDNLLGLKK